MVNGTTRLQPCVLQIGQAAGMLAALSVLTNQAPIKVPVRLVQEKLLNAGVYIMPYMDVEKTNMHFNAVQKMGATGLLKGVGTPSGWANKTYFNPTKNVQANEFVNTWLSKFPNDIETKKIKDSGIIDLTKKRGESNGVLFFKASSWFENLIKEYKYILCLVTYEQSHHRGGASTEIEIGRAHV